jgi:hypothetical protein
VNNREIYIMPVINVDGYVYNSDSGGAQSNWRKNRRSPVPPSIGIDLNRNFGYKWGYDNQGSSGQPSQETYRGPSRFSEIETQNVRDFCAVFEPRTQMDFHTFGGYNMYPWGYDNDVPPDQAVLHEAVDTFQVNNQYPISQTGQVYSTIYACNGLSVDWEYSDTADKFVTYAYTCELGENDFWYGYNDSNYIRSEVNLNLPNLFYLTRLAGVFFDPASVTVNDSVYNGNRNLQLDPGEHANVWFSIRNRAMHPMDSAYAITARLVSGNAAVQVLDSVKSFPSIARRTAGQNDASQFTVAADDTLGAGTHVPLRLEVSYTDAGYSYTQPVNFELVIGSSPVAVAEKPAPVYPIRITATPNPGRDRIGLGLNAAGRYRLELFAEDGTRVLSTTASGRYVWDCSKVPAGVYFCRVSSDLATYGRRLVVTH